MIHSDQTLNCNTCIDCYSNQLVISDLNVLSIWVSFSGTLFQFEICIVERVTLFTLETLKFGCTDTCVASISVCTIPVVKARCIHAFVNICKGNPIHFFLQKIYNWNLIKGWKAHSPTSQNSPWNPGGQAQVTLLAIELHVPLFWQVMFSQ